MAYTERSCKEVRDADDAPSVFEIGVSSRANVPHDQPSKADSKVVVSLVSDLDCEKGTSSSYNK